MLRKIISLILCFSFSLTQSGFAQGVAELNLGQYLGQMGSSLKPERFRPLHLRYFSYDISADNFQLLLDKGDNQDIKEAELQEKTKVLMEYFQIGLALPNDKFWVNLRPDAQDQIIDPELEKTDLGKVMLEADLQLKKDTAQWTSPQTPEGRLYWDKLYQKAKELFGKEPANIPTITRPWIVPGEIIVREGEASAYIFKANMKVMLEEDYLSSQPSAISSQQYNFNDPRMKDLNTYSTQLIRELIIPKLTKEVNTSKRYAALRQVFFSLVMARWFKERFKGLSPKGTVPFLKLIDSGDLSNLTSKGPWSKTTYFNEYKKSFEKGEYNFKEQVPTPYGQVIRSYVSGGLFFGSSSLIKQGYKATKESVRQVWNRLLESMGLVIAPDKDITVAVNYFKESVIKIFEGRTYSPRFVIEEKQAFEANFEKDYRKTEEAGDDVERAYAQIKQSPIFITVVPQDEKDKIEHVYFTTMQLLGILSFRKGVSGSPLLLNVEEAKKQIWDVIDEFNKESLSPKRNKFDSLIQENPYWKRDSRVEGMKKFFEEIKQAVQTYQGPISNAPSLKNLISGETYFDHGALGYFIADLINIDHNWDFAIVKFKESLNSEQDKILGDIREIAADANRKLEEFYEKLIKIKWNIEKALSSSPQTKEEEFKSGLEFFQIMLEMREKFLEGAILEFNKKEIGVGFATKKKYFPSLEDIKKFVVKANGDLENLLKEKESLSSEAALSNFIAFGEEIIKEAELIQAKAKGEHSAILGERAGSEVAAFGEGARNIYGTGVLQEHEEEFSKYLSLELWAEGYLGDIDTFIKTLSEIIPQPSTKGKSKGSSPLRSPQKSLSDSFKFSYYYPILIKQAAAIEIEKILGKKELKGKLYIPYSFNPLKGEIPQVLILDYSNKLAPILKELFVFKKINMEMTIKRIIDEVSILIRSDNAPAGFSNWRLTPELAQEVIGNIEKNLGIVLPKTDSSPLGKQEIMPEENLSSPASKYGGIDFRSMQMLIQPMGSFSNLNLSLPTLSSSAIERIDLDKELASLRKMASSGILPSGQRVKEYEAALFQKGRFEEKQDDLLVCLAEIYRLAEEENLETGPELRESLVIADTGRFILLPNNQRAGLN